MERNTVTVSVRGYGDDLEYYSLIRGMTVPEYVRQAVLAKIIEDAKTPLVEHPIDPAKNVTVCAARMQEERGELPREGHVLLHPDAKLRADPLAKRSLRKLSDEQVREIIALDDMDMPPSHRSIAERYDVSCGTVARILRGETYRDVKRRA